MLIGNGRLTDKIPMTFLGRDWTAQVQPGALVGLTISDNLGALSAIPNGTGTPVAWMLPRVAGRISAFNTAKIKIDDVGTMVGGKSTTGESSITISIADATGELISSGNGSATITLDTNTPLLTASIGGSGSAALAVTTNVPTLGAEASLEGAATITVTIANAVAWPLNDASPLRNGSATMTFTGSLTPYAIGQMSGSTVDTGVLTADSITTAVWNAILADFTTNGTAGKALATAGSGGVDLDALAQAILAAAQLTPIHADVVLGQDSVADAVFAKVVP